MYRERERERERERDTEREQGGATRTRTSPYRQLAQLAEYLPPKASVPHQTQETRVMTDIMRLVRRAGQLGVQVLSLRGRAPCTNPMAPSI